MRKYASSILGIAAVFWLLIMLPLTRYSMLDDSLIHLRYASFLHDLHFITFDGVHPSFGTSSLLYVSLLAVLRNFTASPMLPKCVSVFFYLAALLLLWRQFVKMSVGSVGRWLTALLFVALLSVMGIRWLTDGMETSLTLFLVLVLVIALQYELEAESVSLLRAAAFILLGFCVSMARIELSLLVGLSCLSILFARSRTSAAPFVARVFRAAPLGVGTALALAVVYLHFHSLLPDTAIAKSSGHPSLIPIYLAASALTSSVTLGAGVFLIWLVSAAAVYFAWKARPDASRLLPLWALCNSSFPLFILLACRRTQSVEGVRHILWTFFFSVVWNIIQLRHVPLNARTFFRPALIALSAIFVLALPIDEHFGLNAMLGRSKTYLTMRDAGLERFRGQNLITAEVGFISYFTQGNPCDMDGLVNGRTAASLNVQQRLQRCIPRNPELIFASASQAEDVKNVMPIDDWTVCTKFDFVNVRSLDRHYLIVKDPKACGPLGILGSVSKVIPHAY